MGTFTFPYRLPNELMQEFGVFADKPWAGWEIEPAICDAIRAYMKPQPAAKAQPDAVSDAGYQWKQVFLPEGTRLRASFGRAPYFAVVQGSDIRCGEQSLSPSAFANLKGSGNRNAWKAVWLRFPGSEQWVLADTCRVQQKALIARLFGAAEAQQTAATSPAMPVAPAKLTGRVDAGTSGKTGKRRRGGKGRKHGKRHKQSGQRGAQPRPTA
jgi:hypothetical protein